MLNDFRKSIQSVLYERVRSPFSGAFFFSWFAWNWKLIYYLLLSNNSIPDRFIFVEENYINIYTNLIFPFLSTVFLIVVYPFITTGGYWIWLKFKTWQINIRNDIEKNQLLTLEQSIIIRMQIRNQEAEIDNMLRKKDEEILLLKKQLEKYTIPEDQEYVTVDKSQKDNYENEFQEFRESKYYENFVTIIQAIASSITLDEHTINPIAKAYYESNDIIKPGMGYLYSFTEKGQQFVKYYLDQIQTK
jgi:hypothetical protein